MRSHFLHLLLFSTIVAVFFAFLMRSGWRARLKLGGVLWLVMVAGSILLAALMYPFPD